MWCPVSVCGRVCSWVVENLCPCSSPCAKRVSSAEDPRAWWRTFRFRFLQGVGCEAEHALLVGEPPPCCCCKEAKRSSWRWLQTAEAFARSLLLTKILGPPAGGAELEPLGGGSTSSACSRAALVGALADLWVKELQDHNGFMTAGSSPSLLLMPQG